MNTRRQAVKLLKNNGYVLKRNGASHDVYYNASLGAMITLKRHDFDDSDLRYIKKEIETYKKAGEKK